MNNVCTPPLPPSSRCFAIRLKNHFTPSFLFLFFFFFFSFSFSFLFTQKILAPTDDAFAVLRINATNVQQTNQTALRELLRYHLVDGVVPSGDIADESPLGTHGVTVSGEGLLLDSEGGEAKILAGDLSSSNGMIHAISSVLMPFPEDQLTGDMFGGSDRAVPEDQEDGNDHIEVAALSAGLAAAVILVAAAVAVHKRRQADAAKPPQVAPDDGGWGAAETAGRATAVHPA